MPHFGELLITTIRAMVRTVILEEIPGIQPPEQQVDAELTQANPVSGTKYTVLNTTSNVRITSIRIKVTWTVQPTPLEVHVTIDGIPMRFFHDNPTSAQEYLAAVTPGLDATHQGLNTTMSTAASSWPGLIPFLLEGRSVKVEIETTGGTVSELRARVKYAKW